MDIRGGHPTTATAPDTQTLPEVYGAQPYQHPREDRGFLPQHDGSRVVETSVGRGGGTDGAASSQGAPIPQGLFCWLITNFSQRKEVSASCSSPRCGSCVSLSLVPTGNSTCVSHLLECFP